MSDPLRKTGVKHVFMKDAKFCGFFFAYSKGGCFVEKIILVKVTQKPYTHTIETLLWMIWKPNLLKRIFVLTYSIYISFKVVHEIGLFKCHTKKISRYRSIWYEKQCFQINLSPACWVWYCVIYCRVFLYGSLYIYLGWNQTGLSQFF